MSVENARAFFIEVAQDEDLKFRIRDELESGEPGIIAIITVATEAGLPFTESDYSEAIKQIASEGNIDLDELKDFSQ
ncbi:MAG: Nif11 family protein [Candidatus Lindowbacteria bacterium]|nr:Nif11 family protein [Candidatus Lindowbacteria bacterium]